LWLFMLTAAGSAYSTDMGGKYVGVETPSMVLTLQVSPDGVITGTLADAGNSLPLTAHDEGKSFVGTIGVSGQELPFTGALEKAQLVLLIGPPDNQERVTFKRDTTPPAAVARAAGKRNVIINRQRLSDAEVAQAEKKYRVRIPDADYWYDRVLGAWGARGGPTMGFINPGLDLGGSLQADASGGGTSVLVNGRDLHPYDLLALQQLTGPIMPGRYFITAQGLAGFEGGPPLWDLGAMAAQAQGGGGSNTWQSKITGSSGFSDGTTGAVFLPNGGIVSTGN